MKPTCTCSQQTKDAAGAEGECLSPSVPANTPPSVKCCCCGHDSATDHPRTQDGDTGGNPGRPGHPTGTNNGRLENPNPVLLPGDLDSESDPGSWAGPRKDLFLPFLFMRANPGDKGTRPVPEAFWESPDILLLAGIEPAHAPPTPPRLGDTALANKPNTLYAHVWNFGQVMAPQVMVEFYWCDPSLGIDSAQLIGQTFTSLGSRGSGSSHKIVKCPVPWVPSFVNGGHECLVVRIWDIGSDPLGRPPWDARLNRHVAQRNIHVEQAPADLQRMIRARGGLHSLTHSLPVPLTLKVGLLYGAPATVSVHRVLPHTMPWLQLHTGKRGLFPNPASSTGEPLISPPGPIGGGQPIGPGGYRQTVVQDGQQVAFNTTDAPPGPGEAHVYRVSASQGGAIFGGYTVVLIGK